MTGYRLVCRASWLAVAMIAISTLLGSCSLHQTRPDLDAPLVDLGPKFPKTVPCPNVAPTSLPAPDDVAWSQGTVEPHDDSRYGSTLSATSDSGITVQAANGDSGNLVILHASGGAHWTQTLPMTADALTTTHDMLFVEGGGLTQWVSVTSQQTLPLTWSA